MLAEIYATDTFGGELNYCWKRSLPLDEPCTPRQALRAFRKEFGWSCRVKKVEDSYGFVRWNVVGACIAIVLEWSD